MMKIDVLTLFPRMFEGPMGESIIGKAVNKGLLEINVSNFRDYPIINTKRSMIIHMVAGQGCC